MIGDLTIEPITLLILIQTAQFIVVCLGVAIVWYRI